jgi:preprotein translocase SecY subunit
MFRRISLVLTDSELRSKLLQIIGLLIISRLLAHVPIPLFDIQDLQSVISGDEFLGLLNTISGGAYGRLSFVMLGIGPYITASIVMQLMGVIVPKIKEIQQEGEQGQQRVNRWTRFITVPIAALNSWGIIQFLTNAPADQRIVSLPSVLASKEISIESFGWWSVVILAMTCGSIIMMWIGEIINEYKMGNGISLMILAGISARIPTEMIKLVTQINSNLGQLFSKFSFSKLFNIEVWKALFWTNPTWGALRAIFFVLCVFVITLVSVVFFNDAIRRLMIIYSRRGHSEGKSRTMSSVQADLPIKVTIAGVLPIIFAVSLILFPTILSRFFFTANIPSLREGAQSVEKTLSTQYKEEYQGLRIPLRNPGSPEKEFAGVYASNNPREIEVSTTNDKTKGTEVLGFTLSTNPEIKNKIMEGIYPIEFPSTNLGFLPQGAIRWNGVLLYTLLYFFLIVFFTYFYTSEIAFKSSDVSENLQKSGAYIAGYKPGKDTADYLTYVVNRLNVVGAAFLALIAIIPVVFQDQLQIGDGTLTSVVGGTTLLILVSVTIETLKQIEAQATSVDYNKFTKY